ncbi:unnamed protein product [Colias eurytheme]|nr:unnamed protein product [Colias eurytheme]CAG4912223.1 unnamed protein product [Colias eurytheme]CAG4958212.1 unnamed protein product [Colias eurytheme]
MNNNQSGNPRGRSLYTGGNRRATRDAQRAYNHFNERQMQQDWAFEPAPFDPSRVKNRKPTVRSSTFRKPAKPSRTGPEVTVVPDTVEDPMRDEPLYEIGPHHIPHLFPRKMCIAKTLTTPASYR